MENSLPMHQAKRCRAMSKRSRQRCCAPAVNGWNVCRMHEAGAGAPKGNTNALKHGHYSAAAIAERRNTRALPKAVDALLDRFWDVYEAKLRRCSA